MKIINEQRGFSLVEVIIAIAILAMISAAFAGGIFTTQKLLRITDEREAAKNLAQAQMEYVLKLPYQQSYTANQTFADQYYPGFIIAPIQTENVTAPSENTTMQRITVVIQRNSANYTLQDYKVSR